MEMSRLTRDGTAEPVSRDQVLRRERGQGNTHFPCSADHEQDWQPYPLDSYSCYTRDRTYIHTYGEQSKQSQQYCFIQLIGVCMVGPSSTKWINRVWSSILLVVNSTGKINFLRPRSHLRIWSRETGSAVPSRVSPRSLSTLRLNLVLTHGIPPAFRDGVYIQYTINRHLISPELIGLRNCVPMAFTAETPPAHQ